MWRRVVRKYKLCVSWYIMSDLTKSIVTLNTYRETVRKLLQVMAPEETKLRKSHRLTRRMYHTKVCEFFLWI